MHRTKISSKEHWEDTWYCSLIVFLCPEIEQQLSPSIISQTEHACSVTSPNRDGPPTARARAQAPTRPSGVPVDYRQNDRCSLGVALWTRCFQPRAAQQQAVPAAVPPLPFPIHCSNKLHNNSNKFIHTHSWHWDELKLAINTKKKLVPTPLLVIYNLDSDLDSIYFVIILLMSHVRIHIRALDTIMIRYDAYIRIKKMVKLRIFAKYWNP